MPEKKELILGIDLGGTKILAAVIDAKGILSSRQYIATPAAEGADAVIAAIVESTRKAVQLAGIKVSDLLAVGLGAPGLIDSGKGLVHTSPNLPGWKDVLLRDQIEQALGKPVYMINDAHAAAVGELHFGAGRGCRHFIYITVSTGIGGGLILDGNIYEGSSGLGGEIGHMVIDDDGPLCNCGNRGCWEMLASGKALEREARRRIESGANTNILSFCHSERSKGPQSLALECITAKVIHTAAQAGDALALELINRNAYFLGVGLANIINIFNPECIVIGGGLSNLGDMLLKPAIEEAGRRAFKQPFEAVKFVTAELGGDSGVIGAAAHARKQFAGATDQFPVHLP